MNQVIKQSEKNEEEEEDNDERLKGKTNDVHGISSYDAVCLLHLLTATACELFFFFLWYLTLIMN